MRIGWIHNGDWRLARVALLLFCATSCSLVAGRQGPPSSDWPCSPAKLDGEAAITYYLPKKLLKATLTRKAVPAKELAKLVGEAGSALDEAKKASEAAAKAAASAESQARIAESTSESEAKSKATQEAIRLEGVAKAAKKAAEQAKQAADEKIDAVQKLQPTTATSYVDDLTITEGPIVADTTQLYTASLEHWPQRDDELTIATDDAGLLQTAKGKSVDRTPEILEDSARVALTATKIAATSFAPQGLAARAIPQGAVPCVPAAPELRERAFVLEYTYDPTDTDSRNTLNRHLCELQSPFRVGYESTSLGSPDSDAGPDSRFEGFVYRRPVAERVSILRTLPGSLEIQPVETVVTRAGEFSLPNRGRKALLGFDAGVLTTSTYDVEFKSGMLTKLDVKRPSELYALIQIPLTIAKDVLALPGELIQLKIDYSTKQADLVDAQTKILDAEKKRITAERALEDAQNPASTDTDTASGVGVDDAK